MEKIIPLKSATVIRVIVSYLDSIGFKSQGGFVKIPLKLFEAEGICRDEAIGLINGMKNIVNQLNESFEYDLNQYKQGQDEYITDRYGELLMRGLKTKDNYLGHYNISEEDLKNCIILKMNDLEKLRKKLEKSKTEYNNGILYFQNKDFDFNKKLNQKELLSTLFKEPKKQWYYDEIQEIWDEDWDGYKKGNPKSENYWRKFYGAGGDINQTISSETSVKDFIKKTTKEIWINPKYI